MKVVQGVKDKAKVMFALKGAYMPVALILRGPVREPGESTTEGAECM